MTVTDPTSGSPTAVEILFSAGDDSVNLLADSLDRSAVVTALGTAFAGVAKAGRKAMAREVSTVAARLLSTELVGVLLNAWKSHAALIDAGRRTYDAPGSQEIVELVAHRVTSTHRPAVDLLVDGARVATVSFELALSFLVQGLTVTVRAGELVEIHAGRCKVAATLVAEAVEIARGETTFDLGLGVRLEQPIRLWPVASQTAPIKT